MAKRPFAAWGILFVGILSFVAALLPLFAGRSLNVTFLGAGVVFVIIGGVQIRRHRERSGGR